jgi:hypothetical protein
MVRVLRRRGGNGLLVRSDLDDLGAARREVGVWVRERAGDAAGAVRTLKVAEGGRVVREYLVLDAVDLESPSPPASSQRVSCQSDSHRTA